MAASVSYTPGPHEQAYYQGLFQMADSGRTGNITGGDAVAFFSRSKLQVDTLKNIWTLADQPATNTLDHRKFAVAIRLIQLAQNGHKAQGATLTSPPGVALRPAYFEGVTGVAIQAPPMEPPPAAQPPAQQQQQQQGPPPAQYGQPPVSPQPQYAQPPPAQVQPQYTQPPAPQQQQPPASPLPPPVMSMALTPQDPYTLTPQERQRYETLFPQYQKPDGFIYGTEAVALFSKSGVSTDNLRDIWNMVDIAPVDNRLDKLEFAMAMHLIVCVSKKNLPCPKVLPYSLKVLKVVASEKVPAAPPTPEAPPTMQAPPVMQGPPTMQAPPVMPTLHHEEPSAPMAMQFSTPPPLAPVGGLAISDAFEGLSAGGGSLAPALGFGGFSGTPSYVHGAVETVDDDDEEDEPEPAPRGMSGYGAAAGGMAVSAGVTAAVSKAEPPKTTQQLAQNYNLGDTHTELGKLQVVLQKLQAENISLRAQVGSMTEEEKDVQKQIGATVEEISKLSGELTNLRAQVLASKSRLLESTAELQAGRQKIEVLTDLISETRATKEALETANTDINNSLQAPVPAPAPVNYEQSLFSFDAPAPMGSASLPPAANSFDEPSAGMWGAPSAVPMMTPSQPAVTNVASYEEGGVMGGGSVGGFPDAPAPVVDSYSFSAAPTRETFSAQEVASLKSQALVAERASQEAEEMLRTLTEEADMLRRLADEAEADALAKQEKAEKMGRGLGGGKKKKAMKDAELALSDAAAKRKHCLEMEGQAANATQNVAELKQQTEQMRQQFEQAELDLASAESVRWTQPASSALASAYGALAPVKESPAVYNNYGVDSHAAAPAFGNPPVDSGYGNGAPLAGFNGTYGAPMPDYGGGFGGGIMGVGGSAGGDGGIPTPPRAMSPAANDPYSGMGAPSDPYSGIGAPSDPYSGIGAPSDPYSGIGAPSDPYNNFASSNDPYSNPF